MNHDLMKDLQQKIEEITVEVQYVVPDKILPSKEQLSSWVKAASHKVSQKSVEILIRIVAAEESRMLNFQYRDKDKPTNVLSFCAEVPEHIDSNELGDIVICAEVVECEAEQQNKDVMAHWAHMVVHGVLHLHGYDHQSISEAEEMEQIETEILAKLGFQDPYKES